jgi:hypothetical protein
MNAQPVDVLESLAAWCNEKNIGRVEYDYRSAIYAAVAELIEVAEVADSLVVGMDAGQVNHHHVAELRRLLARPSVRAALARIGGAL